MGWQWEIFLSDGHRETFAGAVRLFISEMGGLEKMESELRKRQKAWMAKTMPNRNVKKRKVNHAPRAPPKRRRVLRRSSPAPAVPSERDDTPSDAGSAPGAAPCLGVPELCNSARVLRVT